MSIYSNQTAWRKANLACKLSIDNLEKDELLYGGDSTVRQRCVVFFSSGIAALLTLYLYVQFLIPAILILHSFLLHFFKKLINVQVEKYPCDRERKLELHWN